MAVRSNRQTKITFLSSGGDCLNPLNWGGKWSLSVGNKSFGSDEWDLLPEDSFDDFSDDDQSLGVVDIGPDGDYNMHKICLGQWDTLSGGGSQIHQTQLSSIREDGWPIQIVIFHLAVPSSFLCTTKRLVKNLLEILWLLEMINLITV